MKSLYSALIMLPLTSGVSAQEKPMNILCLVCEDISPFIGCYGDKEAKTPNINRLAAEGVRFTNFCTTMGVCAPSRSALITGMYPTSIGANQMRNTGDKKYMPNGILPYDIVLPEGVKCFTEFLRMAGYYCTNNAKTDYQFTPPLTAWDENSKDAHWKHAPKNTPFFSIFNFEVTHESQIWKRASEPLTINPAKVFVPPYYPDDSIVRRDIARMYSNIEVMDKQVQEKIDELKSAGLFENTIIIFYSDNGGPLPRGKREVYNSGLQVPLIIRYPDMKDKGTVDDQLCSFVDIPTSILSLAEIKAPPYMHGKAFVGKFKSPPREFVYGAKDRCDDAIDKIGTIRDKRYQYIRNYMPKLAGYNDINYRLDMPMMRDLLEKRDAGTLNSDQMKWFAIPRPEEEFYDLQKDPHEMRNLINNSQYSNEVERLRKSYNQWLHDYNENWFLTEQEMVKLMIPEGSQKEVCTPFIETKGNQIEIYCKTPGSSIAFRILGKNDAVNRWQLYTHPITLNKGEMIEAIGCRIGYSQSEIVTKFYN